MLPFGLAKIIKLLFSISSKLFLRISFWHQWTGSHDFGNKVISFVFVPSIGPFLFFQTLLAVGISGVLVYLPSMVASNMLGLFSSKLHVGVSPI